MEGFIVNLLGTVSFSGLFLMVFFLGYYLYLKGKGVEMREEDKEGDMNKRLGKGF